MAENENRNMFGLHGISGMLIATALLLSILAFLVTNALTVQQDNAQKFYYIENAEGMKMIDTANEAHRKYHDAAK